MTPWPPTGLPPLTWAVAATWWRVQPAVLATAVVLLVGYVLAVGRAQRDPRWPRSRTVCFAAGVVSIVLVGCSFLGVYSDTLFWVRAVQNVTLLMVTPMLVALGAPITVIRDVLPPAARAACSRILHSRAARVATFPLIVTVVLVLPLPVLYLSPLYELTLRNATASGIAGAVVAGTGFAYFWSRFRIDPTPRADHHGLTLIITVVEMIGDAALGVIVWLGPLIASTYYVVQTRDWGPSPRTDQTLGAGVLWVGGDVAGLPFMTIVFHRMAREDHHRAELIDAELDEQCEHRFGPVPGQVPLTGRPGPPPGFGGGAPDSAPTNQDHPTATAPSPPAKLWWEDHPELADRFRRR